MNHKHTMEYEFEEGKFPRGWRGDMWCKSCDYSINSREARRMEMFGLARAGGKKMGNGDEIWVVDQLKV